MSSIPAAANSQRNKRIRRDSRNRNDTHNYSRSEAMIIPHDLRTLKAKNPTRLIPDIPGFVSLSKNEIKTDSRDIQRLSQSSMLVASEDKQNGNKTRLSSAKRATKPLCEPASTLFAKKIRFLNWLNSSDAIATANKELQDWERKANSIRIQYERQQIEEELWGETFQFSRTSLLDAIRLSAESNLTLRAETNRMFNLIEEEQQLQSGRKRRIRQMKDVLAELHDRDLLLEERIQEYEDLAQLLADETKTDKGQRKRAKHDKEKDKNLQAPVVSMEIAAATEMESLPSTLHRSFPPAKQHEKRVGDADIVFGYNEELPEAFCRESLSFSAVNDSNKNIPINGSVQTQVLPAPAAVSIVNANVSSSPAGRSRQTEDLPAVFTFIEESVRTSSHFSQSDVDFLFSESRMDWEKGVLHSLLSSSTLKDSDEEYSYPFNAVGLALHAQRELAAPLLSLDKVGSGWGRYLNAFLDSIQPQETIVTRRKKRDLENAVPLPASANLRVQPPRGVSLLLSPLSQYDDRMLGTLTSNSIFEPIHKPNNFGTPETNSEPLYSCNAGFQLPIEIKNEEDAVLERCHLQSCAAIAELKLRRLYASSGEGMRGLQEGEQALARRKAAYLQALHEDASERQRIHSELQHYGLTSSSKPAGKTNKFSSPSKRAHSNNNHFTGSHNNHNNNNNSTNNNTNSNNSSRNGKSSQRKVDRSRSSRPPQTRLPAIKIEAAVTRSASRNSETPTPPIGKEEQTGGRFPAPAAPPSRSSFRSRGAAAATEVAEGVMNGLNNKHDPYAPLKISSVSTNGSSDNALTSNSTNSSRSNSPRASVSVISPSNGTPSDLYPATGAVVASLPAALTAVMSNQKRRK